MVATLLAVIYTAVLSSIAAAVAPFFHGRLVDKISWLWSRLIIKTCGVTVETVGLENLDGIGAFVGVANHQSFFDIFALFAYLPREVRFVAKKELLKIPIFGLALKHAGHVIIDRQRGGQAIRGAIEAGQLGFCILFFAEGTRFTDNQVHPFNDGAAWIAIQLGLPCVPIAISGSGAFYPRKARVVIPGGRMRLAFGRPIPTQGLKSRDRIGLTKQLEEAVRGMFSTTV